MPLQEERRSRGPPRDFFDIFVGVGFGIGVNSNNKCNYYNNNDCNSKKRKRRKQEIGALGFFFIQVPLRFANSLLKYIYGGVFRCTWDVALSILVWGKSNRWCSSEMSEHTQQTHTFDVIHSLSLSKSPFLNASSLYNAPFFLFNTFVCLFFLFLLKAEYF